MAREVTYRIARTRSEREAAFRLVYRRYLEAGLSEPSDCCARVTPYHLSPETDVFLSECEGHVFSTLSLVRDGPLGLPLERIYPEEIATLRLRGLRLGEITSLAGKDAKFYSGLLGMTNILLQYSRRQGLDGLVLMAAPKHARLYCRSFDFRQIGSERQCAVVCGRPGVALLAEFDRLARENPAAWQMLVGEPLEPNLLLPAPMDRDDREYFRPMISRCYETY